MAKLTLNAIGSRYGSIDALNDNFDAIEQALENTLSRDGTSPNALEADLDMNGNSILNAGDVNTTNLYINGVQVEPSIGVTSGAVFQTYEFTAISGQTTFSVAPSVPQAASLTVSVNGLVLPPSEISVNSTNVILPACTAGDEVLIRRYTTDITGSYVAPTSLSVQRFSGNGVTTSFTLGISVATGGASLNVYVGGIYQNRNTYTSSGNVITFTEAPPVGTENIEVLSFDTVELGETSSDLVSYLPEGTGVISRTVENKLRESVSVKDFGAVGDGIVDDTVALQNTLNTAGHVHFPIGTYRITSTLKVKSSTYITGEGTSSIVFLANSVNTHIFENENYASGTNENITFDGLIINGNVANQTNNGTQNKHGIRMKNVRKLLVKNCVILNVGTDCINLIECNYPEIIGNDLYGAYNHAVTFQQCDGLLGESNKIHNCGSKTDATGFTSSGHAFIGVNVACNDVRLLNNYVFDMGDSCLRNECGGAGWIISNNLVVNSGKDSIKIMGVSGSDARPVANVISGNVIIDAGNDGIVAIGKCVVSGNYIFGTGKNTAGAAAGKWFSSASGIKIVYNSATNKSYQAQIVGNYCQDGLYAGIYVSGVTDVVVRDNYCSLNGNSGIASFDSSQITIEGNDCWDNGVYAGGFGSGVRSSLFGAGPQENTRIRHNSCRNTSTTNQAYGVFVSGTSTNNFLVQYNDVRGNSTTGVLDTSTGSGTSIGKNTGYTTENSGTATVASGNTTVTVTHGLSITPSAKNIILTPTNNLGLATKFWIGTINSSTFIINVDINPGATTATFSWQIVS